MSDLSPFDTSGIDADPAPNASAPQPLFDPPRQARFLDALAASGNVRNAAAAAGISPQTAYRARRAEAGFALLWDGALLHARAAVEQVLADRALNGVDEPVFYRGEEIGHRRRYDSRLLLAHLARLDRLAERAEADPQAGEAAQGFDQALEVLASGEDWEPAAPPAAARHTPLEDDEQIVERALRWLEANGASDWDDDEEDEEEDPPRNGEGDHAQHGGGASPTPDPHDFRQWRSAEPDTDEDDTAAHSTEHRSGPSTSCPSGSLSRAAGLPASRRAGPPPPLGEDLQS